VDREKNPITSSENKKAARVWGGFFILAKPKEARQQVGATRNNAPTNNNHKASYKT
jgi:hypothetical protein